MKQLLKREAEAQTQSDQASAGTPHESAPSVSCCFADALVEHVGNGLSKWAESNRGAFVVAALEAVPSAKDAVGKVFKVKAAKERLIKTAEGGTSMGAKVSVGTFWHLATISIVSGCIVPCVLSMVIDGCNGTLQLT